MISLAYKLISVKCPDCGQTLSIEENRTQAFCTYCGAKVLISNENEYVFRQVDEAGIQKAETDDYDRPFEDFRILRATVTKDIPKAPTTKVVKKR